MRYWWVLLAVLVVWLFLVSYVSESEYPSDFVTGADHNDYIRVDVSPGSASPGQVVCIDFSESVSGLCGLPGCRDMVVVDSSGTIVPCAVSSSSLPYFIEPNLDGHPDLVWVKIPRIPAGGSVTLYAWKEPGHTPQLWDGVEHLGIYGGVFDYNLESLRGGDVVSLSLGEGYTCALLSNGNVHCWGLNYAGQASDYTGGDAVAVSAEFSHTCALLSNGNVHCWGSNTYGQLEEYTGGDAIAVTVGAGHTCALLANGNVHCWGRNDYGQANDYTGGDAIAVSAGYFHTCALLSNGDVHCWGYNGSGQANDYVGGDAIAVVAGGYHTCVLLSNGNVHCWGANGYGQAEDYNGGDAVALTAGRYNTCVLLSDGDVRCWGSGVSDYDGGYALAVSVGDLHTCVLLPNGNIHCWGSNYYGQSTDYTGGDVFVPFRQHAEVDPPITVAGFDGYYEIVVENNTSEDLVDYQVAIPSSDLGVASTTDSLAFVVGIPSVLLCFDPSYDGTWQSKSFYVLLGSTKDYSSFRTVFDENSVGDFSVVLSAVKDVVLYPGRAVVRVSPSTSDPGDKTVTISVQSDASTGVSRTYCSVLVRDPLLSAKTYSFDVNGDEVSFTHPFSSEGVYVIEYNCSVFFTEQISGAATHTIVVPDPSVPDLNLYVYGIPDTVSDLTDVNILVLVASGGIPVENVSCYFDYNGQVYISDTNADGYAMFSATLYPGSSGTISCYESGYHPASYVFSFSSQSSASGEEATSEEQGAATGGGVLPEGGASVGGSSSSGSEISVQPASPVVGEGGVPPYVVIAVVLLLGVFFFLRRRHG